MVNTQLYRCIVSKLVIDELVDRLMAKLFDGLRNGLNGVACFDRRCGI